MKLLLLIFLASAQVLTSNADCSILPITPTVANGLTACGYGGLVVGCFCCPDQQTACQSLTQECTLGLGNNYICVNLPQYTDTLGGSSKATVPATSPSTTRPTATSPAATAPALSSATRQNTATTSTSASPRQSSLSNATRRTCGGITSLVMMVVMNGFIFCWL